ncbi:MAG: threonylcarbamoyl-AMP synthase [Flavobacterium sp.]|nr:threonylcarbamoyl-AMP synthase [Flavobacterium sp.]
MKEDLHKAKKLLICGNVVAIPTETVYGLAANAFDADAIAKIFEIKGRPLYNPLIVHIKSIEYLDIVAENIPEIAYELARKFWPGPLTLVLPKKEIIPNIVTSGKNTVGVRVPAHEVTLELLNQLDFPLAAPSANPFGYISPTTVAHVKNQLGTKVELILDGGSCKKGIESTIIGFENGKPILYRVGAISQEEIENIIGKIEVKNKASASPDAPGMLSKHYSPKTKFIISDDIKKSIYNYKNAKVGFLLFSNLDSNDFPTHYIRLSKNENLNEAAHNLYAAMHQLDSENLEFIIAERFPSVGIGVTLNDRLQRAQETNF